MQEFAEMQKAQGAFVEEVGNDLLNESEGGEKKDKGDNSSKMLKLSLKLGSFKKKKKKAPDDERDALGRETGHFKNSIKPY